MISTQAKTPASRKQRSRLSHFYRRDRGSLLVLVVVSLVVMTLIGSAYIQVARMDRIATRQITARNIDQVKAAIIGQIVSTLTTDVVSERGFFIQQHPEGSEYYDYPFTSQANWPVTRGDGSNANAKGNFLDDTWLAATMPDFSGANPVWPHLTNLNGIFLRIPLGGARRFPGDGGGDNGEDIITNTADFLKADTDVDITDMNTPIGPWGPMGIDADGDGIEDSRLTWAPIRQISGVSYVMAVRIIDLSSLANANVGLGLSNGGISDTSADGLDAPRWDTPAEVDFGQFVRAYGGTDGELGKFLYARMGSTALPTPYFRGGANPASRFMFWQNGPRRYGNYSSDYQKLGISTELELRYRNGLDDPNVQAAIEDQRDGMPNFLRHNARPELSYSDVDATIEGYLRNEPRHLMTAHSGHAIYAAPFSDNGTDGRLKVDLNGIDGRCDRNDASRLRNAFLRLRLAPPAGLVGNLVNQFTASIVDYADDDNVLTKVVDAYGMEALPFITEIYVQRSYVVDEANTTPNGIPGTDPWTVRYQRQGDTGYAIEIRNPFRRPIYLEGVYLSFDGGPQRELSELWAPAKPLLEADEVIVLYRRSHDGSGTNRVAGEGAADDGTDLVDHEAGFTYDRHDILANAALEGNADVLIQLLAETTAGTDLVYQEVSSEAIDDSGILEDTAYVTAQVFAADVATEIGEVFKQRITVGNANGLNMLAISEADWMTKVNFVGNLPSGFAANFDKLGEADKTGAPGPTDVLTDTRKEQLLISDVGRIDQVGELAHIALFGPTETQTVAEVWNGRGTAEDFMLDFNAMGRIGPDNLEVPWATTLLDSFTTLSPAEDNEDNDGDSIADTADLDEQLVPGTINLNTMSADLLRELLPIPDAALRDAVVAAIIDYRDNPSARAIAIRRTPSAVFPQGIPGIFYMGELMSFLDDLGTDAVDNRTENSVVVDFLANPDPTTEDGITDDREEKAMITRWLAQVASTRSDFYAAYVKIFGYPSRDFQRGPVEFAHFYLILDRSGIVDNLTDRARVLAVRDIQ